MPVKINFHAGATKRGMCSGVGLILFRGGIPLAFFCQNRAENGAKSQKGRFCHFIVFEKWLIISLI